MSSKQTPVNLVNLRCFSVPVGLIMSIALFELLTLSLHVPLHRLLGSCRQKRTHMASGFSNRRKRK